MLRKHPVLERMMGVEPTLSAWEAGVLPMNYIRDWGDYITDGKKNQSLFRRFFFERFVRCSLKEQSLRFSV